MLTQAKPNGRKQPGQIQRGRGLLGRPDPGRSGATAAEAAPWGRAPALGQGLRVARDGLAEATKWGEAALGLPLRTGLTGALWLRAVWAMGALLRLATGRAWRAARGWMLRLATGRVLRKAAGRRGRLA